MCKISGGTHRTGIRDFQRENLRRATRIAARSPPDLSGRAAGAAFCSDLTVAGRSLALVSLRDYIERDMGTNICQIFVAGNGWTRATDEGTLATIGLFRFPREGTYLRTTWYISLLGNDT